MFSQINQVNVLMPYFFKDLRFMSIWSTQAECPIQQFRLVFCAQLQSVPCVKITCQMHSCQLSASNTWRLVQIMGVLSSQISPLCSYNADTRQHGILHTRPFDWEIEVALHTRKQSLLNFLRCKSVKNLNAEGYIWVIYFTLHHIHCLCRQTTSTYPTPFRQRVGDLSCRRTTNRAFLCFRADFESLAYHVFPYVGLYVL